MNRVVLLITVIIVTLILFHCLTPFDSRIWYKLKLEISLRYVHLSQREWWTQIEPNIYLGAMPLKNKDHLNQMIVLGINSIIVVQEEFESEDGWFDVPVKDTDYVDAKVNVLRIKAKDGQPLKKKEIREGVTYLNSEIEKGKVVYTHCKAGRGRSVTIIASWRIKYRNESLDEAIEFLSNLRPEINLNTYQRQSIIDYIEDDNDSVCTQL